VKWPPLSWTGGLGPAKVQVTVEVVKPATGFKGNKIVSIAVPALDSGRVERPCGHVLASSTPKMTYQKSSGFVWWSSVHLSSWPVEVTCILAQQNVLKKQRWQDFWIDPFSSKSGLWKARACFAALYYFKLVYTVYIIQRPGVPVLFKPDGRWQPLWTRKFPSFHQTKAPYKSHNKVVDVHYKQTSWTSNLGCNRKLVPMKVSIGTRCYVE